MQQAADANLAELVEKAETEVPLTSVEARRYGGFIGARVRNAEEAFLQYRDGQLDEQYFLTRASVVLGVLNNPQAMSIWTGWKESVAVTPEFSAWVDARLAQRHIQ